MSAGSVLGGVAGPVRSARRSGEARAGILAFAALCAIAPAASADTIVVSPLDQPTLQAAISGATSGDVITFPPGGGTIALTSTVDVQKGVDIEGCPDPNSAGPCVTLQAASGFDALDVTTGGAAIHGLTITGAAVGIHVTGGSSTTIGGPAPGQATTISQSAGAAIQVDNPASGVTVDRVAGSGNGGPFISLVGGANGGAQTPAIVSASTADIIGLATPGALVRVYAAPGPGSIAGFAGTATADATGVWDLPDAAVAGETVAATATGSSGTSQLSASTATAFGSALVPIAAISGTGATVTTATPAFTLSSSDPSATLLCRVDSRLYAICPTVYQTASLTQGEHTLDLRAAGTGGLSSEVSDTFDVDLVPSATIRSGPPRYGRKSSGIFRFTVPSGTRSTRCAVDDARFKPCSGSFHTGYLLDGRHIFHLRTTDALGQATVLDTVFTIDTLAPRVSLATASLRIADTITAVTVTCPASEPGGCSGSVRIGTRPKKHSHKPFQEVGSATWQAGPTVVDTIPIQVPAWALAASQRGTGQPIWVVVVAQDDAGNAKQLRRKGKLLPPLAASGGGGVGV